MGTTRYTTVADLAPAKEQLTEIRRHLHQHPELSYQEEETASYVAEKLIGFGYEVTRNIGGHGIVATLRSGTDTRSIGIRADMDALPIHEQTGLPHASKTPGVMHACGHDGHTTVLLGAAQHLAKTRNFNGIVHLIFQPAEETGSDSGAERMIADGLFERFPCDAIFGMHNSPGVPLGHFGLRAGPMMAAADTVKIHIHGRGAHAARPHEGIDPLVIASSLVMALQTIVSRNINPMETAVVTIGSLHSGFAANVIPDEAKLELSVRSFTEAVRKTLNERICALVKSHVEGYGASADITYIFGPPPVVNSEAETEFARQVAEELVGPECIIHPFPAVAGSEDFSFYLKHRPGSFVRMGIGEGRPALHNPKYDFNDDAIPTGSAFWCRLVERFLA